MRYSQVESCALPSKRGMALNALRNRRLLVGEKTIAFANRWHERVIEAESIEWIYIGREAQVQTGGRFQVVVMKLKGRRRLLRIRVGRYERDRELVAEMQRIAAMVPRSMRMVARSRCPGAPAPATNARPCTVSESLCRPSTFAIAIKK